MNYPTTPTTEEQKRLFVSIKEQFMNDWYIVIPEPKSWEEYMHKCAELAKLEEDDAN